MARRGRRFASRACPARRRRVVYELVGRGHCRRSPAEPPGGWPPPRHPGRVGRQRRDHGARSKRRILLKHNLKCLTDGHQPTWTAWPARCRCRPGARGGIVAGIGTIAGSFLLSAASCGAGSTRRTGAGPAYRPRPTGCGKVISRIQTPGGGGGRMASPRRTPGTLALAATGRRPGGAARPFPRTNPRRDVNSDAQGRLPADPGQPLHAIPADTPCGVHPH